MKQIFILVAGLVIFSILGFGIYSFLPRTSDVVATGTDNGTETIAIKPSKYDGVNVKTIERRENTDRSLLNVAYPVTENDDINQAVEKLSQEFIDSFTQMASSQEAAYQKFLTETGEKSFTTVTDYTQHFDVSFANETYLSFVFDRYENTGGTGNGTIFTKVYNRKTGDEVPLANLFTDSTYLNRLSDIARTILHKRTEEEVKTLDGSKQALIDFVENSKQAIDEGTKPVPENFKGLVIDDDGTLTMNFDKYQVGPGSSGIVSIEIPLTDIADILAPTVRDIFSIAKPKKPEPAPEVIPLPPQSQSTGPVDCDVAKCVALTFDDGPSIYTNTLLDTLKKYNVPATFFVLGRSAQIQPDTIVRIVKDGHELGNHTWDHKDLRTLSGEAIDAQLRKTDDLIYATVGIKPLYLRPPYGAFNSRVLKHVNRPIILWSVDPEDWKLPSQSELIKRMTAPSSGAIILAHDIHASTVAAISEIIAELKRQGFTFVTVSNLLGGPLESGVAYSQR